MTIRHQLLPLSNQTSKQSLIITYNYFCGLFAVPLLINIYKQYLIFFCLQIILNLFGFQTQNYNKNLLVPMKNTHISK